MEIEKIRHSLSHIMASVVAELYPGAKFGIGIFAGAMLDFVIVAGVVFLIAKTILKEAQVSKK
jgi:large-conductance mechanosensitive channel